MVYVDSHSLGQLALASKRIILVSIKLKVAFKTQQFSVLRKTTTDLNV